uniref:Slit2 protein n=1 Tax=Isodiametra pulchra TaxID=504439 RepID=A0A2P1DV87_ISOPU|nr:slit2 protein [Isodiametra pulchra]
MLSQMRNITLWVALLALVSRVTPCPSRCRCDSQFSAVSVQCDNAQLLSLDALSEIQEPERVVKLDLSYNNLTLIGDLSNFPSLDQLLLDHNQIEYILPNAFSKLANLERLSLKNNRLQQISPRVFQENSNLQKLDLSFNKIQKVSANDFKYTSSLRVLKLDHNLLLCIEDGSFAELFNLETLQLNNNNLTTLSKTNFLGLRSLKALSANDNNLLCDCELSWLPEWLAARPALSLSPLLCRAPEHLKLSPISALAPKQLTCDSGGDAIQQLYNGYVIGSGVSNEEAPATGIEKYCPATHICPEQCTCTPEGPVVDCSDRGLTHIPYNIPENVRDLQLQSNKIRHIPKDAFTSFKRIAKIDICNNRIETIDAHALSGLRFLTSLSMYSNRIQDLPSGVFSGLTSLNILLLNANKIKCIRKETFAHLSNLRLLSLFGNEIQALHPATFSTLNNRTSFHLGDNPLICDCNLGWIKNVDSREASLATCLSPSRVSGRKLRDMTRSDFTCIDGEEARTAEAGECKVDLPCPERCSCLADGTVSCRNADFDAIPRDIPRYTTTLDLYGNNIQEVKEEGLFVNLKKLRKIDLSHNNIESIQPNSFEGAEFLESLVLSGNKLSDIDPGVFKNMRHLERLELRENSFRCIRNDSFSAISNLRMLDLGQNGIKTIDKNAFNGLNNLQTLNLLENHLVCNCHLSWLNVWLKEQNAKGLANGNPRCQEPARFRSLPIADLNGPDLTCSDSDYNGCELVINCPPECVCSGTKAKCSGARGKVPHNIPEETTDLVISPGFIQTFDPQDFAYLPNLKRLDLSHNNIDRIIAPNASFDGLQELQELHLDYNYIRCIRREMFGYYSKLRSLTISANSISQIPEGVFEDLRNLKTLEFADNQLYCDCKIRWLAEEIRSKSLLGPDAECVEPARMAGKSVYKTDLGNFVCESGEPPVHIEAKCNACVLEPCQNNGTCTTFGSLASEFECECLKNYGGKFCEEILDYCYESPCKNGGTCISDRIEKKYTCVCPDGFTGSTCSNNVNDCAENDCRHGSTCVDGINGYSCECPIGYAGKFCEIDIDICAVGTNPCRSGAVCVDKGHDYTCECAEGFQGRNCDTEVDFCSDKPCKNGGICISNYDKYTCECALPFFGDNCEFTSEIEPVESAFQMDSACSVNPCLNEGLCSPVSYGDNSYKCTCINGFSGLHCEQSTSILILSEESSLKMSISFPTAHEIELNLNVYSENGRVLYSDLGSPDTHFILEIIDGKVHVSYKMDPKEKAVQVFSEKVFPTPDGTLTKLVIQLVDGSVILKTSQGGVHRGYENRQKVLKAGQKSLSVPYAQVYLGSLPASVLLDLPEKSKSFIGCISSLKTNGQLYNFEKATGVEKMKPGSCEGGEDLPISGCDDHDCQNGGICTENGKLKYECACQPGWLGERCEKRRKCGAQKSALVYSDSGCESVREYNIVNCPELCYEGDAPLCCQPTRFRTYNIKYLCGDGSRTDAIPTHVVKKCHCEPCPS